MPDFSSAPLEKFVALTKRDLATQLSIDVETILLTNSMQLVWPDSSLGCPRPSVMYAKGLVPGYKIWLMANQVEYIYHTDLTGRIVLCPDQSEDSASGTPPVPGSGVGPTIGVPIK